MSHDPLVIHLKDPAHRHVRHDARAHREESPTPLYGAPPRSGTPLRAYKQLAVVLLVGAVLIAGGWGVYLFMSQEKIGEPVSPAEAAQLEGVIAQVGKLMLLPENEQPAIATVTDLNPLSGQAFFANASIGDVVLMYKGARKAILYSPQKNKIIEVAPITTDTAL